MRLPFLWVMTAVLVVAACNPETKTAATDGGAGGQLGGGTGGVGGPAGSGGAVTGGGGGGGAVTGAGGTATGGGSGGAVTGSGGSAGGSSDAAGTDGLGPGNEAGNPTDGGASGCPAGTTLCDDFESYSDGAASLSPNWAVYTYAGGTLHVDSSKPFKGKRALHITSPTGSRKYADIIKDTPDGTELLPLKHYGRVMVWVTAIPSGAHWNINQAGGLLPGSTTDVAKYSYGGMFGMLHPNYTRRTRVINGAMPFRGGGPENGDDNNPATLDCSTNATSETLPKQKWVCWEWTFDGAKRETHLWLDGVPQPQVDVVGMGRQCQDANHTWDGPRMFTRVIVGWEQYTSPASEVNQEIWLDDLAMGPNRVGCPP